jgi:DNA polymerase III delta prime subunit
VKKIFNTLIILFLLANISCGNKAQNHGGHDTNNETGKPYDALYNQVMDIHDEVMPKTEDLYNLSKELKQKIKTATTDEEKKELQSRINYLDSVNNMMMDWMHDFRPVADSIEEEAARAYYETELEKVKKVKEAILMAVEKEKNPK